jgi:serine-type D-Ala-D-Ala carboxypeptidase/endopeptidase
LSVIGVLIPEMKNSKTLAFILLFLTTAQFNMAQNNVEYQKIFREKLETEESKSSIVAVFVDDKGARFANYGKINKTANSAQADENTIYEIGSITKLFVGVLLAEAVKKGELKLDAPISAYLPKTVKTPTFNGKEITLIDLATHTSGLPRLPDNFNPKNPTDPYADYTAQNLYDFLSNYKLTREIGLQYDYSNLGIGLLGHILSLRAGMSFEQLITTRIFQPLKMNDTSLGLPDAKKVRHAQGLNAQNEPTPNWYFDALAGAGAIRSTSADMAKFISASVGLTPTPLADSFAEARKMQRQGHSKNVEIGLCWNNVDLYGTEIFWHGGGTYGFSSYIAIDPNAKKGAFLVTNSGTETGSVFLESVAFNFLQPKFAIKKPIPPKKPVTLSEEILDKYIGEYQIAPNFSLVITREGKQLFLQATGQSKLELFATKEDEFFLKAVEAELSFTKNADGRIAGATLRQGGQNIPAKKVK